MSINSGVDKEAVVYIHNGILLSHKKNEIMLFCSNTDGPRGYHTKCSKPKEKDKYHIISITYMWNLKYDTNDLT